MTRRIRVLPYRQGSRAAAALSRALGGRVLRLQGAAFRPRANDLIINYGNTDATVLARYRGSVLKNGGDLRAATNKLSFFQNMERSDRMDIIPRFWTRREDVPDEAFRDDGVVVCRTNLAGHSGDGIVLASNRDELVPCSLYVQYVKKQQEYRVHMGRGPNGQSIIIDQQRKARSRDVPDDRVNWQVRNLAGGFIYAREGVVLPDNVITASRLAFEATALDFGAVDVIWNERQGRAYVLEINTAPGLTGTTIEQYANFFRRF